MHKVFSFILIFLFPAFSFSQFTQKQQTKASRIHKKVFTVDSHDDTPMNLFEKNFDLAKDNSLTIPHTCVDIPRMTSGGIDAIFFAVFEGQGSRTPDGNARALKSALKTFDSIHSAVDRCKQTAAFALSSDDGYRLEKEGKKAIFIGVENGYPIGKDCNNIKLFYDRGARYITLCHTKNNDICSSSTDTNNSIGLSAFGRQVIAEMNSLGMMVDVSHASDASFYDILKASKTPVIASHSCSRALCNNPRNLNDDMLKTLAKDGGVVQLCILSAYIKSPAPNPARDSAMAVVRNKWHNFMDLSDSERDSASRDWYGVDNKYPQSLATVSDVCDHIDHIVKVAGINHIGIGTDFDGGGGVTGLENVGKMGNITLELVKRGYTERQIAKIWGGNLMRVMRKVEHYAGS
ncbi:MAG: dipeptidase [Bacteroidales bacterium]